MINLSMQIVMVEWVPQSSSVRRMCRSFTVFQSTNSSSVTVNDNISEPKKLWFRYDIKTDWCHLFHFSIDRFYNDQGQGHGVGLSVKCPDQSGPPVI